MKFWSITYSITCEDSPLCVGWKPSMSCQLYPFLRTISWNLTQLYPIYWCSNQITLKLGMKIIHQWKIYWFWAWLDTLIAVVLYIYFFKVPLQSPFPSFSKPIKDDCVHMLSMDILINDCFHKIHEQKQWGSKVFLE